MRHFKVTREYDVRVPERGTDEYLDLCTQVLQEQADDEGYVVPLNDDQFDQAIVTMLCFGHDGGNFTDLVDLDDFRIEEVK